MAISQTLTASLEDYLEVIFHIIAEKKAARPKDIAKKMKVSNSSVTGALRSLAQRELIHYAPYDVVTLTPGGSKIAKDVVRRHEVLKDFFVKVLAVEDDQADEAACKMEHSIPKVILDRFIQFAEFVELCPRGGSKWVAGFGYHCDSGADMDNCERCISVTLDELRKNKTRGEGEVMPPAKLKEMKPGTRAKIVKINSSTPSTRRIVEMGVTPGSIIEVERVAPFGDPMEVKVKGYHLTLRKQEAEAIDVEPLS